VKLIKREESHYLFLVGKREREMLFSLLRRFPVVIGGHFRTRHPPKTDEAQRNQQLLEEALAEQQKENKAQVESFLAENSRFGANDLGYTFRVSEAEMEWLLQVLNDIRVGSWIQLGEPDPEGKSSIPLTEKSMQLTWGMEMAGLFQHALLEATQSKE
jgi:hypothetical protein